MSRRRQTPEPVPLTPTHRRDWRTFWRRCTCGLTSPCVDRLVPATPRPFPPRTATPHRSAGSAEERSPRYPTLIEYLATVPFPVHYGVAVLRVHPTEPSDSPEPSLPRAPVGHPGGSGALGGPGSRPCPGSRAGAAPTPFSHTPTEGHIRRRSRTAAVNAAATRLLIERVRGGRRTNTTLTNGGLGPRGERAGERVGRLGPGDPRAGSNGGRRGRPPAFGGRPAMASHHINLSRR